MGRLTRTLGPAVPIAGALALWIVAVATVPAETPPAVTAVASGISAPAQASGNDYVGEETCLTCHEDKKYDATAHGFKANERTPSATHGCESCHGAGQAHVEGGGDKTQIVNPKNLTPQESSETCTACHDRKEHALWAGSQHDQRNVGCVTCHSVHAPKGEKQLKAETQPELCGTCHKNITNKQQRFNHMPVREGKISCSSCHNVHGSANVKLLKVGVTVNESCMSCHAEKRGPMLWEHPPVAESCVTCHDPHGSNNDRMLVAKQPFLCQRCHVTSRHPPTVYDKTVLTSSYNANKIYGRSCVICHQMVHGSNAPTGKAFLR
jgi:DmsE family decaheme c-type cytochrome